MTVFTNINKVWRNRIILNIKRMEERYKELLENFIEAMKVYEYTGFDNELFKLLKNVEKELSDEN